MGGRGASSGISDSGKPYGTEFTALAKVGNVKILEYNDSDATKVPMESMTKGRIYGVVNKKGELKSIVYYDKHNKRMKQIDLDHMHRINGERKKPHVHFGYMHNERGDGIPTAKEQKMIDLVEGIWYKGIGRL